MAGFFSLQRHKQHSKRRVQVVQCEREQVKVDRDDFLLSQIDEFREKAKQLQEILATKESKAQELETIVKERESKADELQQILDERQRRADGISQEVSKQIDVLIDKVHAKMQEIEQNISTDIEKINNSVGEDVANAKDTILESVDASKKETAEQNTQMLDSLSELNEQLLVLKQELSEKVHTENVKSYRNIQDLFKIQEEKIDGVGQLKTSVKKVKSLVVGTLVIGIINILGIIAIALYVLGIIRF